MAQFNKEKLELFLGVVRKYMQVRGALSQKDLAELSEIGVSTLSRFLNSKTSELNPQLIARIVAKLDIPFHEVIDFVEEGYSDRFVRLVKFYREDARDAESEAELLKDSSGDDFVDGLSQLGGAVAQGAKKDISIREKLERLSPRQKAYLTDFLNLDMEGRDLVVDLGNALFSYLKQKGMDF